MLLQSFEEGIRASGELSIVHFVIVLLRTMCRNSTLKILMRWSEYRVAKGKNSYVEAALRILLL
jgi:hypothetical protein